MAADRVGNHAEGHPVFRERDVPPDGFARDERVRSGPVASEPAFLCVSLERRDGSGQRDPERFYGLAVPAPFELGPDRRVGFSDRRFPLLPRRQALSRPGRFPQSGRKGEELGCDSVAEKDLPNVAFGIDQDFAVAGPGRPLPEPYRPPSGRVDPEILRFQDGRGAFRGFDPEDEVGGFLRSAEASGGFDHGVDGRRDGVRAVLGGRVRFVRGVSVARGEDAFELGAVGRSGERKVVSGVHARSGLPECHSSKPHVFGTCKIPTSPAWEKPVFFNGFRGLS